MAVQAWKYTNTPVASDNSVLGADGKEIQITRQGMIWVGSAEDMAGTLDKLDNYAVRAWRDENLSWTGVQNRPDNEWNALTNAGKTCMSGGVAKVGETTANNPPGINEPKGAWKYAYGTNSLESELQQSNAAIELEKAELLSYFAEEWQPGKAYLKNEYVNYTGPDHEHGRYRCEPHLSQTTYNAPGSWQSVVTDWKRIGPVGTAAQVARYLINTGSYNPFPTVTPPLIGDTYTHTKHTPMFKYRNGTGYEKMERTVGGVHETRGYVIFGSTYKKEPFNPPLFVLQGTSDDRWLKLPYQILAIQFNSDGSTKIERVPYDAAYIQYIKDTLEKYFELKKLKKQLYYYSVYAGGQHPLGEYWLTSNDSSVNVGQGDIMVSLDTLGVSWQDAMTYVQDHHELAKTTHGEKYKYEYWFGFLPFGATNAELALNTRMRFLDFHGSSVGGSGAWEDGTGFTSFTIVLEKFQYYTKDAGSSTWDEQCVSVGIYIPPVGIGPGGGKLEPIEIRFRRAMVEVVRKNKPVWKDKYPTNLTDDFDDIGYRRGTGPQRMFGTTEQKREHVPPPPDGGGWRKVRKWWRSWSVCEPPFNERACFGAPCIFCWQCYGTGCI